MIRRFLIGAVWLIIGYFILRKRRQVVDLGFRPSWARSVFGSDYTFVGFVGIAIMATALLYAIGAGGEFLRPVFEGFGDMFKSAGKL